MLECSPTGRHKRGWRLEENSEYEIGEEEDVRKQLGVENQQEKAAPILYVHWKEEKSGS